MKPTPLIAIFALLLSVSLFVGSHDRSVAPLRRSLAQRSFGRLEGVPVETVSRKWEGEERPLVDPVEEAMPDASVVKDEVAGVTFAPVAAEVAAVSPADDVEEFAPVSASSPGNALRVDQRTVVVRGFRVVPGASGVALAVSVEDGSALKTPDSPDVRPEATASTATHPRRGLTYEDELFRTRWGWSAFADVQHAALEAHSD